MVADGNNENDQHHGNTEQVIRPPMDWSYNDDSSSSLPWNGNNSVRREISSSLVPNPSSKAMETRGAFRQSIKDQTSRYRIIHSHGGIGVTGCNIVWSLWDRERRGARACVLAPRRQTQLRHDNNNCTSDDNRDSEVYQQADSGEAAVPPAVQKKQPLGRGENYPMNIFRELRTFAEYCSVVRYQSSYFHHLGGNEANEVSFAHDNINTNGREQGEQRLTTSSPNVSTISIAFSPDAHTMASTHGDHTLKITCCSTGRLMQTLEGHPRTPWTIKYHPKNSSIVASGCLGFQVRVWDWPENACLQMIRLHHAIISLSFHPTGHILAIASGSRLHFWDYNNHGAYGLTQEDNNGKPVRLSTRGALTEVGQRHMLRCVHFPPGGKTLIVGGINPTPDDPRKPPGRGGVGGGNMSFYLRLWDFSVEAALHPYTGDRNGPTNENSRGYPLVQQNVLNNPRTFVPRALLYNDGGFDVSPDGKRLCACADYWLPDGVNSAMELLQQEEEKYDNLEREKDKMNIEIENNGENQQQKLSVTLPSNSSISLQDEANASVGTPLPVSAGSRPENVDASISSPPRNTLTALVRAPNNQATNPTEYPPVTPPNPTENPPVTPPNPSRLQMPLSPPSPPGRRWLGGLGQRRSVFGTGPFGDIASNQSGPAGTITSIPPPSHHHHMIASRPPHRLSVVSDSADYPDLTSRPGRYVPHVITVSLDATPFSPLDGEPDQGREHSSPVAKGYRPRLGQLLEACPLDGTKAAGVTCVKFSPSTNFCLLGYGVREPQSSLYGDDRYHPVAALYRVQGGMTHISTMLSGDDDVNIARFHPNSGYGFVYGTKQGRVRVLSPRPWNYYDC